MVRTAGDAPFTALIPIIIPGNSVSLKGSLLKSIDVYYKIATAAADDFATVELEKMTLGVDDVAVAGAAVAGACDTGHDSAAKRLAVDDDHVLTFTLTDPVWIDDGDALVLQLVVDCAASTVFHFLWCACQLHPAGLGIPSVSIFWYAPAGWFSRSAGQLPEIPTTENYGGIRFICSYCKKKI